MKVAVGAQEQEALRRYHWHGFVHKKIGLARASLPVEGRRDTSRPFLLHGITKNNYEKHSSVRALLFQRTEIVDNQPPVFIAGNLLLKVRHVVAAFRGLVI